MNRTALRISFAVIAIGVFGLGLSRLRSGKAVVDDIPSYGKLPGFSLMGSNGRIVTLDDLKGRVWVADFIFTSCAGTCPLMSLHMRQLQDNLPPDIRLVSFTVDPARDTASVLAHYAQQVGADLDRWVFLTGDRQALYDVSIKGFKLAIEDAEGSTSEPITHSTRFALVDKDGDIRGYYSGTEDGALKQLTDDARKLL